MALPASLLLRRGIRRRCPVCGTRGLFRRWLRMVAVCPGCGFTFKRNPGHWLGSWFLSIVLVQTLLTGLLILEVSVSWPDRPPWYQIALLPVVAVAVPLAVFPVTRTLWSAVDLIMRPLEFDDGVAPAVELEQLAAAGRSGPSVLGARDTERRPPRDDPEDPA